MFPYITNQIELSALEKLCIQLISSFHNRETVSLETILQFNSEVSKRYKLDPQARIDVEYGKLQSSDADALGAIKVVSSGKGLFVASCDLTSFDFQEYNTQ